MKNKINFLTMIIFTCIAINQTSFGQKLDLSDEQRKMYIRQKLSIETMGIAISSYNESLTRGITASWRKWEGYKGFQSISESYFFSLAGYDKEAEMAKKYKDKTKNMISTGLFFTIIGFATGLVVLNNENENDDDLVFLGGLVSSFGVAIFYNGCLMSTKNWAPCGLAIEVAEEYNKKLILRIKIDEN